MKKMNTPKIKTYSELRTLETFEQRFNYLSLKGIPFDVTFGYDRVFNQMFYQHSREWQDARRHVILRDYGCDLGCKDHPIRDGVQIIVHHMNPIDITDIRDATEFLLNEEYLITTVLPTHNAIHYGTYELISMEPVVRKPNDTCPWK